LLSDCLILFISWYLYFREGSSCVTATTAVPIARDRREESSCVTATTAVPIARDRMRRGSKAGWLTI
jgi:hypothetical protein